ncbi:MAG: hypothetical protein JWO08_2178 [Verrucomicrobiaceae bacterium]|nr:hypothetical protein [Verrucomicrobiaceae bacterium]
MLKTITLAGTWLALPDIQAGRVDLENNSGSDIQIRYVHAPSDTITRKDGRSVSLPIPNLRASTIELNGTGEVDCVFTV